MVKLRIQSHEIPHRRASISVYSLKQSMTRILQALQDSMSNS